MLFLVICDTGAPAWVGVGESDGQKQAQPSKVLFKGHVAASLRLIIHQAHTAFNICLFPPLFFFSALYYTDVASTVSVLVFHRHFLSVYTQPRSSITQDILTVILGAATLFFRQTNIFWVSVFPVGMLLVSNLGLRPDPSRNSKHETSSHHFSHSPVGVSRAAWSDDILFDPPVKEARIDGMGLPKTTFRTRLTLQRLLALCPVSCDKDNEGNPYISHQRWQTVSKHSTHASSTHHVISIVRRFRCLERRCCSWSVPILKPQNPG